MEAETDIVVSLDELTLDLSELSDPSQEIDDVKPTLDLDLPVSENDLTANDTNFGLLHDLSKTQNENSSSISGHQDHGIVQSIQTENQISAEVSETVDVSTHLFHESTKDTDATLTLDKAKDPTGVEDFEAEVPPLALFPSTRKDSSEDSDSEFEFEVLDRPSVAANQKVEQSDAKNQTVVEGNSGTKDEISAISETTHYDIDLQRVQSEHLEPEILTPRDKTFSDFTNSDLSKKVESSVSAFSPGNIDNTNTSSSLQPQVASRDQGGNVPDILSNTAVSDHIASKQTDDSDNVAPEITLVLDETDVSKPSIVTTAEDWDNVQTVEPGSSASNIVDSKPLVTVSDAWTQFESFDYSAVKDQIKTQVERKGFSAFTHLLFGPPKLHRDLQPQRELLYSIAATPMDNENESHIRVLQTVYRCLTGSKFDGQRFGGHWEEIGFQGRDPATDLRGTGMLALLHILCFLRDASTKQLARDVYKLSLHPTQNFPFCIMSINLSRICLQVFREEVFNKECNRRKNVISTMNDVHAALFLQLYQLWKKGKTIADSGFVLQDVESYCRKHSKNLFKDLETYEKMRKQQGPFGDQLERDPTFFSVCKEEECDDKSPAELY